jgi:hypothetical protein
VENTYYYTGRIDISDIHPRYSFYQNDLAIRNTADVTSGKSILSNNPRVLFLSRAVYENKPKTAILETIKEENIVCLAQFLKQHPLDLIKNTCLSTPYI